MVNNTATIKIPLRSMNSIEMDPESASPVYFMSINII